MSKFPKFNLPSLTGIPKCSLDFILHYLTLQKIRYDKHPHLPLPFYYKRHPHFLFQYHKNFRLVSRLKGSALSLLKTQFAKKPKNPV
jgi:hypothetical protein